MQQQSGYSHQDWSVVTLKKRQPIEKVISKQVSQNQPKYKADLDKNDEIVTVKRFEKEYIDKVVRGRIDKKWTQQQLANAINENVQLIQRFEQAKETYNHVLKSKLNRALGITN